MTLPRNYSSERAFSLIELMIVVAILGILATIAGTAYTRQIQRAHRGEVIADLSNLSLRQKTFLSVSGRYASSATSESTASTYPTAAQITAAPVTVGWDIEDAGYTASGIGSGAYARGGAAVHGFDALRFMPESGESRCGYATISGGGSNSSDPNHSDTPPNGTISEELFPATAEADILRARDWFYSFALCDFDKDSTYWAFRTAHYTSRVLSTTTDDGVYVENE